MLTTRTIDVNGVATRVFTGGRGQPLVIIHGGEFGMLYSLDAWDLAIAELQDDYAISAFDRLGQGGTDNPPSHDDYTFAAVLEHATGTIEALCPDGAHVVGHSRGGLIAARLAQQRPDLVRTLVVVASNSLAPVDPATPVSFYADLEARLPNGYQSLEDVLLEPRAQSCSTEHLTDEFAAGLLRLARLPKTLEAQHVMREIKLSRWYPDVDAARDAALAGLERTGLASPTGLIWGLGDPSAPPVLGLKLLERFAARTPRTGLHVIARAGHYSFRERPREFAALVRLISGVNHR
jgi:pimeloyl-ACP methyl ester carboxylesterase